MIRLALKSLRARWPTALLAILAIALSTILFLGVERMRSAARDSFAGTISGTDLIVGARSGGIQLLLYSVFRIGNATNNVSMDSISLIEKNPNTKWLVPLSLGDSHRGFRVLGTNRAYFERYRYRDKRELAFDQGQEFNDLFDAVVGSQVAESLGYRVGDPIVVAHGLGRVSFAKHEDTPFTVSGVLAPTGTPVDRTVHVSLEAIEAIHVDWQSGGPKPGAATPVERIRAMDLTPTQVTAALVGVKSRARIFGLQRAINTYDKEPLLAILPGATLQELWGLIGTAERVLLFISAMVVVTALLGMVTMVLATLNERRREMAILRSLGAGPATVAGMLALEAGALTLVGVVVGTFATTLITVSAAGWVDANYGIALTQFLPNTHEILIMAAIVLFGILASLLPAWRAYRLSLADGMTVRV